MSNKSFFLHDNFIEIGNDVVTLFRTVPVICIESADFLGLFGEVGLIVFGVDLTDSGLCKFLHKHERAFLQTVRATNFKKSWLAGRLLAKSIWLKLYASHHEFRQYDCAKTCFSTNKPAAQTENLNANCSKNIVRNNHKKNPRTIPTFNQLCIVSRNQFNRPIMPSMFFDGEVVADSFSISHVDSHVAVFFAKGKGVRIGCDLVNPDSITDNLQKLFYAQNEIDSLLNSNEKLSIQFHKERIWGVKETAFKILGNNRTFKPAKWLTTYIGNSWYQCHDTDSQDHKTINIHTLILKNKILTIGFFKPPALEYSVDTASFPT
jgi:hypothetical protein